MPSGQRSSVPHGLDWTCMIVGTASLIALLAGLSNLPAHVMGHSISEDVEQSRRWICYLVAVGLAPLALWLGRHRETGGAGVILRAVGLVCGAAPLLATAWYIARGDGLTRIESPRRAHCVNNLKHILFALANYESANGSYPPVAITDRAGRPLLSWHVAILPFLEEPALFEQFHLDEPWDSEHNRPLLSRMPRVYACPSQAGWIENQTLYQALVGPNTMWSPKRAIKRADVTDGSNETIMVVEADRPVPWTKPDDIIVPPNQPPTPWESSHPGGFNAGFLDGSVRFLRRTIRPETLGGLITRDGGERLSLDEY